VQQILPAELVPRVGPLADKSALGAKSTAFACLGTQCSLPVTEAEALLALLRRQRSIDTATLSTAN
jgi:hypothetical protein